MDKAGRSARPGPPPAPSASLYVHIPFCAGACDYCDFYSVPAEPEDRRIDRYIGALLADAEKQIPRFEVKRIPTVYIGGGTPSLLGASRMERLLRGLGALWPEAPEEITVEANPESAGGDFLRACRDHGVSRISLGIQTFHEPSRRAVRRVGKGARLEEQLALVSRYYGGSFSADLITGLPYQDESVVSEDIKTLLSYGPAHVSLYALTAEEGTPLAEAAKRPGFVLPRGDEADRLWITGRDALEQAGYAQYEVSNFALPGGRSAHNIRYWRMENWLGLGTAASGTVIDDDTGTGRRYTQPPDVEAYIAGSGPAEEALDRLTLMKETFLMGFRYIEGPDRALFARRFGPDMEEIIPETLARWRGLLAPDRTALTPEGLLLLDPFLLDCFKEAERSAQT
jgi:oxygen-independent coproporphyrinogen-3 oxidase